MTLIAHGVLALNKMIQERKLSRYKEYADAYNLHEKLINERAARPDPNKSKNRKKLEAQVRAAYDKREQIAKKLDISELDYYKQLTRTERARERMGKLKKFEDKLISLPGDEPNLEPEGMPIALAGAIAVSPIRVALQIKKVYDDIKAKKAKIAEEEKRDEERFQNEKRCVEGRAQEIREQKERDSAARIDELMAEPELQELVAFFNVINEAKAIEVLDVDDERDSSAITNNLVNRYGEIVRLNGKKWGEDYIVFLYRFVDNIEANVFFINPKTGNFEQIGNIKSKYGIDQLKGKINGRILILQHMENKTQARRMLQESRGRK